MHIRRNTMFAIGIAVLVCGGALSWWFLAPVDDPAAGVPLSSSSEVLAEVPAFDTLGFATSLAAIREHALESYQEWQQAPLDAERNGHLGMVLSSYGKHAASEILFTRARALAPDEFRWRFYLANAAIRSGDNERAIDLFREALELKPDYVGAQAQLAALLLQSNALEESIAMYRKLTRSHPERVDAWLGLGKSLHRSGDLGGAELALQRASASGARYGEVHYALARVLNEAGESERAAAALEMYERTRNTRIETNEPLLSEVFWLHAGDERHMLRGDAYARQARYADAAASYRAATEVNPSNQNAWGGLVQVLALLGNMDEATARYEEALEAGISYHRLHLTYGQALIQQQRVDEARDVIKQALDLDPKYTAALSALGQIELSSGEGAKAADYFRRVLAVQPNDRNAQLLLGRALNLASEFEEAVSVLEPQTKDPETDRSFAYLELANALLGLERKREAIEALRGSRDAALQASNTSRVQVIEGYIEQLEAETAK